MKAFVQNRWQLILLILVCVGFALYRGLGAQQSDGPVDLSARKAEIAERWYRIPDYPGASTPEHRSKAEGSTVVDERFYRVQSDFAAIRSFYQKELQGSGWEFIGEQQNPPDFGVPILLFRSDPYHLILYHTAVGVGARMVWDQDGDILRGLRLLPPIR
jgi:hypothetical protein